MMVELRRAIRQHRAVGIGHGNTAPKPQFVILASGVIDSIGERWGGRPQNRFIVISNSPVGRSASAKTRSVEIQSR